MSLGEMKDEETRGSTVGHLPTLMYYPNFFTEAEERQLLDNIYQAPVSKWKKLMNRRLQNWGGVVHEKGLISQDLPSWLTTITRRICEDSGIFPAAPNHVLINEYLPDQGIMPHQDGPAYFPAAAILSLGSPVVMDFTPHAKLEPCGNASEQDTSNDKQGDFSKSQSSFSLLLMPRSLLIFKDLAYSDYLHGIKDSEIQQYGACVNLTEDMKNQIGKNSWGSTDDLMLVWIFKFKPHEVPCRWYRIRASVTRTPAGISTFLYEHCPISLCSIYYNEAFYYSKFTSLKYSRSRAQNAGVEKSHVAGTWKREKKSLTPVFRARAFNNEI